VYKLGFIRSSDKLKNKIMDIYWNITKTDIAKVKKVISDNDNDFLAYRRKRNIEKQNVIINEDKIIKAMILCLLTSQQQSGPNSKVAKFLSLESFPITEEVLIQNNNLENFIRLILQQNDLKRFINKISNFFTLNYNKIKNNNWSIISTLEELLSCDSKEYEREIADKLSYEYKGFGPKQSRNFLQVLGLTKYEIPIDSRITRWLNDFGFPLKLGSSPLSNIDYYHFVSNGIQELCQKAEIYPCILDAAIFSSFDNQGWKNEHRIF
jgi:hypothetical protein